MVGSTAVDHHNNVGWYHHPVPLEGRIDASCSLQPKGRGAQPCGWEPLPSLSENKKQFHTLQVLGALRPSLRQFYVFLAHFITVFGALHQKELQIMRTISSDLRN